MKRGAALSRAIDEKADEKGLHQKEVAAILGVSEPYFNLLLAGDRWFGSISEDKLRAIADFLEVPLLSVFMLAEIIRSEDFFRASNINEQLDSVFKALVRDKRFVSIAVAREDWDSASLRMRIMCAVLYQGLSNKDILERFKMITLVDEE